ncbi:MAG: gamma-glutamyl-gamma-aminobutyrate hydrolase family protein [Terracidiphilus sp.]|jgi:putative glutamine amidotransferase
MAVRIAIPVPTSSDPDYNLRSLPPYVEALRAAGAEPVVVPLDEPRVRAAKLLANVQGVLLPGSRYDVDPARYGEARAPECAEDDPARTAADELLLEDAFDLRRPVLAICHGTQSLNVWRHGTLIQDLKTNVNHRPGRDVVEAHAVRIAEGSRLAGLLPESTHGEVRVNSSHHQAIRSAGDSLRVVGVSAGDGVIEAVELDAPDHFVVAVQWHPERTYMQSAFSRAIFSAFLAVAASWKPRQAENGRE